MATIESVARNEAVERSKVLSLLFSTFGQDKDANRLAIYVDMLKCVPVAALKMACKKLMLTSKFLPSIAEIVEAAKSITSERVDKKDELLPPELAWLEVQRNAEKCGCMKAPKWSSPVIEQAVRVVGWRSICYAQESAVPTIRAQFREIYKTLLKRKNERELNAYLFGERPLLSGGFTRAIDVLGGGH